MAASVIRRPCTMASMSAVPSLLHTTHHKLGLRWADVDLDTGTLSVCGSLKVSDHGLALGPTKNKASRRCVPLNKSAVAALQAHRLRQNEERLRLGELWKNHDLIFPNRVGKPINPSNLYHREFKSLLKRAGLWSEDKSKRFTFHSLRHTCATLLLSKNVNPKIVQEMLGHATITQTMDTYSHVLPGMSDVAATALEEALG